jgi:hypothetical protein
MPTTTTIAAIGATKSSKFISEKMPASSAAMPASAKYFYKINKI